MAAPTRKLAELFYELRARTEGLDKDVAQAERSFGKLTTFVLKNPVAAVAAVGTALLGVAIKATQMALDVERGMRRVAASTSGGTAGLKQLRADIEALSLATGRSQAELANAAALAAKSAGSTEEVGLRLRAALDLAQASGEDLETIISETDQVLDTFGLSSKDAASALATLFAAAQGRQPITDLFAALESAAPAINRLGLDIDTVARALVALGERGLNAKKAAAELEKLSQAGASGRAAVLKLAAEIPTAANALAQLQVAADSANNSTDALNARLRADLGRTLIDLGNRLLPHLNQMLKNVVDTMDILAGRVAPIEARGILSTVQNLGPLVEKLETQGQKGAKGLRDLVQASQDLAKALRGGDLKLKDLGVDELERLRVALEAMTSSSRISQTTKSFLTPILETVEKLIAEAPKAEKAVSGITTPRATGLPSDRVKADKERAEALQKQAEAAKVVQQAFEDLFAKARAGEVDLRTFDHSVRDLVERFQKDVPDATGLLVALFDELIAESDDVRESLRQLGITEAAQELDALFASMTTTAVDDLQVAFRQLQQQLSRPLVDPKRAAEILRAKQALIDLTKTIEANRKKQADAALVDFERGELMTQIVLLNDEFRKISKEGAEFDEVRRAIIAEIAKLMERIAQLKGEEEAATEAVTAETAHWSAQLAEVANIAFGIATALAGADSNIARAIGSTAQLLTSMNRVVEAVREAGSLTKLLSTGGGALTVFGGLGAAIGAVSSLVNVFEGGGESPETQRAREEAIAAQRELVQALDRVRDSIGDLARFGSSGADIAAVQNIALTRRTPTGGISGLEEIDFFRPVEEVLAELRKLGVGLDDLREIAADAGITLSDSPTIAELQRLQTVLKEIDFGAFLNTFGGQFSSLQQRFELFGTLFDEPAERFAEFVKLLNDPDVGAPALFGAFEGLDTATAEGREAIQALIRSLFEQLDAGQITPEMLHGLGVEEFREMLSRLNAELGDIVSSAADAAAEAARRAREEIFRSFETESALEDIDDPFQRLSGLAEAIKKAFPEIAGLLDEFDLSDVQGVQAFGDAIPDLVKGLQDGSIVMEGLSDESLAALIAALLDLEAAGDAAEDAIASLADQLSDAFSAIDLDALIFGGSDAETLNKKFEKIGLGAFDLASQAGREAARSALQALATGDPSLKPLIADLIRSLDALPEIPGAVGDAVTDAVTGGGERSSIASAATALTERTGNRMADYLATLLILERRQIDLLEQIVNGAIATRGVLVQPPALSQFAAALGGTTTTVEGGLTIQIGEIINHISGALTDAEAIGAQISAATVRQLADAVSRMIAADTLQRRRFSGDAGLTS